MGSMYLKHKQCPWVSLLFSVLKAFPTEKRDRPATPGAFGHDLKASTVAMSFVTWPQSDAWPIRATSGLVVVTLLLRSLFLHELERIMIKSGVQSWHKQLDSLPCLMLDLLLFIQRHKQLDWRASRQSAPSFSNGEGHLWEDSRPKARKPPVHYLIRWCHVTKLKLNHGMSFSASCMKPHNASYTICSQMLTYSCIEEIWCDYITNGIPMA